MPDVKISVEIEKYPRHGLQELVPEADVVFYSKTWAVVCYSILFSFTFPG